jgi:hypothetical protein
VDLASVMVDLEDEHLLLEHVRRCGDDEYLHRVIAGRRRGDGLVVDHINRNKLDNRRSNLRSCTQAENMANTDAHRDAVSRHKGVYPFRGRWQASYMVNGKRCHVGTFSHERDAAEALEVARHG